jgi:hypothetical protein
MWNSKDMETIKIVNDYTGESYPHLVDKIVSAICGAKAALRLSENKWSDLQFFCWYNYYKEDVEKKIEQLRPCCCWSQVDSLVPYSLNELIATEKSL